MARSRSPSVSCMMRASGVWSRRLLLDAGHAMFWTAELPVGTGVHASRYWITAMNVALVVFGFLAIAVSSQNFLSLVAAGALPAEPRIRPVTFGIRASCLHAKTLIGTVVAVFVRDGDDGFRSVIISLAPVSVVGIGPVEGSKCSEMPINVNPLAQFLVKKIGEDFVRKSDRGGLRSRDRACKKTEL